MRNIYWSVQSGGRYVTDPPARLVIDEYHKKNRVHLNPTNASLQRLIKLSEHHGVEIEDGLVTAYGSVKRQQQVGADTCGRCDTPHSGECPDFL